MLTQNQLEVLGAAFEALQRVVLFGKDRGMIVCAHINPKDDSAWVGLENGPTLAFPFLYNLTQIGTDEVTDWESALKLGIDKIFNEKRASRIAELEAEIERLKKISL